MRKGIIPITEAGFLGTNYHLWSTNEKIRVDCEKLEVYFLQLPDNSTPEVREYLLNFLKYFESAFKYYDPLSQLPEYFQPISRVLFLIKKLLELIIDKEDKRFVDFLLCNIGFLFKQIGLLPVPDRANFLCEIIFWLEDIFSMKEAESLPVDFMKKIKKMYDLAEKLRNSRKDFSFKERLSLYKFSNFLLKKISQNPTA